MYIGFIISLIIILIIIIVCIYCCQYYENYENTSTKTIASVSGEAKNNDQIEPPFGTIDDWNIIIAPNNFQAVNVALKLTRFEIRFIPDSSKKYWKTQLTSAYTHATTDTKWIKNSTTAKGDKNFKPMKISYLIIKK
jgi:hypothetical protein